MITRTTTVGTLKNYRYDLNRSNNTLAKSMNKVTTRRNFNSYMEDPALATRCFQMRRSFLRTSTQLTINESPRHKYDVGILYTGREKTDFAKLVVFGQICFGHHAQDLAATQDGACIVQFAAVSHGNPHEHEHIERFRNVRYAFQRPVRRVEQRLLKEQIAARIARQTQLGKGKQLHMLFRRLLNHVYDLRRVIFGIGDLDDGSRRRHAQKSVVHCTSIISLSQNVF